MARRRLLGYAIVASVLTLAITWSVYLIGIGTTRLLFSGGTTSLYLRNQSLEICRGSDGRLLHEVPVFTPIVACGILWLIWTLYRLKRHLFTILAVASLLVSIAALVEWARYEGDDYSSQLRWDREVPNGTPAGTWKCGLLSVEISPLGWKGFGRPGPGTPTILYVFIPYWSVALPFIIAPAWWLVRYHRRREQTWVSCDICSYNLTANTSGVCPECGTTIAHRPEATS